LAVQVEQTAQPGGAQQVVVNELQESFRDV
jgi:hypothetical protein